MSCPCPCHAPTMPFFSRPQHSTAFFRRPCCAVALRITVWSEHGMGMAIVNQTRPHCVNQMGKTLSKPLAARYGRGTAWARHGNGMLRVNRPLLFQDSRQDSHAFVPIIYYYYFFFYLPTYLPTYLLLPFNKTSSVRSPNIHLTISEAIRVWLIIKL